MKPRTSLSPRTMLAVMSCACAEPNDPQRTFVRRVEAQTPAQHLLDLPFGARRQRGVHCLEDEGAEVFGVPQLAGRRVRNEHAFLVGAAVIRELHLLALHADDVERHAVQPDGFADGSLRSEELAGHLAAEEHHPPLQAHVLRIDEAAGGGGLRAHDPISRRHAAGAVAGLFGPPYHQDVAHEFGAPCLHERQLAHSARIIHPQPDRLPGALAARLHAGLAGKHDGDAVAVGALESAQQGLVEALSIRQQHHHRHDAPGDPQHRQARAHAIARQPSRRLSNHGSHDSNRRASTGGSSAARRAGSVEVTTPISTSRPMAPSPAVQVMTIP